MIRKFVLILLFSAVFVSASAEPVHTAQANSDVARLVDAAKKRTRLWPWMGPDPEVEVVVSYGRAVAPLLLAHLVEDPDNLDGVEEVDWGVQQQVALALCKIYGVSEEAGHVYMNRATREVNASIKAFWKLKVTIP